MYYFLLVKSNKMVRQAASPGPPHTWDLPLLFTVTILMTLIGTVIFKVKFFYAVRIKIEKTWRSNRSKEFCAFNFFIDAIYIEKSMF